MKIVIDIPEQYSNPMTSYEAHAELDGTKYVLNAWEPRFSERGRLESIKVEIGPLVIP
jgi:hypothetical protein